MDLGRPQIKQATADVMRQIFRDSVDGIVITDPHGITVDVNGAYEEITGYSRKELVGKPVGIVKSGNTSSDVYTGMWHRLNTAGRWVGELVNRRKDGTEWHAFLSITRLTDERGHILGFAGIVRDVTDHKTAQQALVDKIRELAVTQDITIKTLALLSEHKDPDISGHLDRIRAYTGLLCEALARKGKHPEFSRSGYVEQVTQSSILHDVGKVGIPEGILFKPAKLSMEEFQVMQLHTKIGGNILGAADERLRSTLGLSETFLTIAKDIALHHHERWDGEGYPDGLRAEAIPLAARIVAVADVYDALTSRRVYKPAWSHAQGRETLIAAAGRQFDPDVVEAFIEQEAAFDLVRSGQTERQEGFRDGRTN